MSDTTSFNQLTPAEEERLHLLVEECADVIHITSKILRHGINSRSPKKRAGATNRDMLEMEIGQVLAMIQILYASGDIAAPHVEKWREDKLYNVRQYLHHNDISKASFDTSPLAGEVAAHSAAGEGAAGSVFIHVSPSADACAHDFAGWRAFADGSGGEQVCTKCGLGAMAWSLRHGP